MPAFYEDPLPDSRARQIEREEAWARLLEIQEYEREEPWKVIGLWLPIALAAFCVALVLAVTLP